MTFILVILTVAIILVIEFARRSKKTQVSRTIELVDNHPGSYEIIDRYYHPGHGWATVSSSHRVTIGIDDFSTQMIGDIDRAELPETGQTLHQGEPFVVLHRGARALIQVSPVSGHVVEVNKKVRHNPGLLKGSPLESGWIARIVPTSLEKDLRNLLKGLVADGWRESVRARLVQLTAPSVGTLLQDGGEIIHNLGDRLSDEDWDRLVQEFFPTVSPNQIQKQITN